MIRYTTHSPATGWRAAAALMLVALCLPAGRAIGQVAFDQQRQAVSISLATQPESAIIDLLAAGIAENKPTQAIAITQRWLRENVAEDPMLLYNAGRAAELSGDWRAATTLYRQYLKRADLSSDEAGDAAVGTYMLLIHHLDDTESAYAFARSEGHRLVACPRARQFDRWFLGEAERRGDRASVAARLLALVEARVPNDVLTVHYDGDFNWLLNTINGARLDQARLSPAFVETVKALAQGIGFDDELKLLLDWAVSIKAYNFGMIAGETPDPPIAEATALLARFPRHALRVQTDWAGGRRSRYYRDDPKKYWPADLDAKLEPVDAAVKKLGPLARADFCRSWSRSYYESGPYVLTIEQAQAFVLTDPKLANSRSAPSLEFGWGKLTPEQAKQLAPHLAQNPGPEAALVRSIAAATDGEKKDFDKAINTLLTTEAWRLSDRELNGTYADQLWHWAGRPGGNAARDQAIKRSRQVAAVAKSISVKKEDPANKRLGVFNQLWADYRSPQPKQPNVRDRLKRVLLITPEALPALLNDNSVEARSLLRAAFNAGITGNDPAWAAYYDSANRVATDRYSPCFYEQVRRHYGGMSRLPSDKTRYRPHPIGPMLDKPLADQIKRGRVEDWLVYAWLNTRFPEDDAASVELMAKLRRSPAWKALPYEAQRGAREWFKRAALSAGERAAMDAADPSVIFKGLTSLAKDADADTAAKAIDQAIDGLRRSPVHVAVQGLNRLGELNDAAFKAPAVQQRITQLLATERTFAIDPTFGARLCNLAASQRDPATIHRTGAYLWRHTEVYYRSLQQVIDLSDALADAQPSASSMLARCGLQTIGRHKRGHTYYDRDTDVPRLKRIRGKAALAMGLIEIPVRPSDPAYGIYRSQAQYVIGNEDSARDLYLENADQLLPVHRELSAAYLLWVLRYTIDQRDEAKQEELAKALMTWMQEAPGAFSLEQRVALEIAYGDIALQRGLLPEAHKIFSRIRNNTAYAPVFERHTATLRQALVERVSGDFDAALRTLRELEAEKVPRLITAARFARAEVYYAMHEYQDAADEIDKVLERDPNHADATILRGRVQLKLQKLIEATEVELGSVTSQSTIVPGEMLKVTLNDPTLTVSQGGSNIEVVVWATSGDKEHLLLRQFGDEKTKYRGEVRTALGKPVPDDRTLQIVGDDEIFYAYSERFRAKMPKLGENRGGPINVASDAMLMASARKLLSENEQRIADMRAATEVLEDKIGRSIENIDPEKVAAVKAEIAARQRKALLEARVKPGNPIYLRVTDPDRGRTAGVDTLDVSVSSSSGDAVGRVTLTETGPYTGRFEGRLDTTGAQALAFGSSSQTGVNPNMVISPRTDYPAWRPVAGAGDHSFTVDLNDDAPIASMRITAPDKGYTLRRFVVQTAMNHRSWTTVASYPAAKMHVDQPWRPTITVVGEEGRRAHYGARSVYELEGLRRHMDRGWLRTPDQALSKNVAGPSEALPESVLTDVKWLRGGRWPNPGVAARFRAYFYEPADVTRRFALELGKHEIKAHEKNQNQPPEFLIAVDGRVITSKEDGKLRGAINLRPGVHTLEVWATGWVEAIGFGRTVKLQANLEGDDSLVDCPDSFFDPTTFPPGVIEDRNAAATVTRADDGKRFDVAFAPGSHTRLVRILFVEQEGPVPSLNRLTLEGPKGQKLLPVATDYASLRKNDRLEIITGDRVTVRYVDDRYVTKGKQKHERFLNVSYTDGGIELADIEPRFSSRHQKKMPYHEKLLRFAYDKPLSIVIHDADMDETVEPDEVACTVTTRDGQTRQLTAVETGPSTGTFRAWVTPVAAPTDDATQIQVAAGGTLTVSYRDEENLTPGVPYDRVASISHAPVAPPRIEVAHATIEPYVPTPDPEGNIRIPTTALNERLVRREPGEAADDADHYNDLIAARYVINQSFMTADAAPDPGLAVVHGRSALVDIVAPHLALGAAASVTVYVQTDAGRKAAPPIPDADGEPADRPAFDPSVPGTMAFTATLGKRSNSHTLERGGYIVRLNEAGNDYERARASLIDGRFRLSIPLITGDLPTISYVAIDRDELRDLGLAMPPGPVVRTGERIHIGVPYTDAQGRKQWATASARVVTRPMLDVMHPGYRDVRTEAYIGEKLFLRVVDLAQDRTDERDQVRVYLGSQSGAKHYAILGETSPHSGVFKAVVQLTYVGHGAAPPAGDGDDEAYDVRLRGFPVVYGDKVGVRYTSASGEKTSVYFVTVAKGADGTIAPFSKRYDDSDTAMKTQFAMAEGFLELARRHRKLGEDRQADHEFERATQLLAAVVAQFTDPETRSHAEYLLGNLTMEEAETTDDKPLAKKRYRAALARYMTVTGTYPDTEFASKAQFQTAVVYERLGEPDIAAQEYVKLAYKYPDSEHLATAMARLGTHFQRKAVQIENQSKPLLARQDDKDALYEGEALRRLAQREYIKAAQIFQRLQERFPSHELAGKAGLRAGQIYMRAEAYRDAVKALQAIVDEESYDGVALRSEALYWSGRCYQELRDPMKAYALFKRITYDFPESKWAAYARAQLSTESMLRLDRKLEIERLEAGQ